MIADEIIKAIIRNLSEIGQGSSVLTIVLLIYIIYNKLKQRFQVFEEIKEKLDKLEEKLDNLLKEK